MTVQPFESPVSVFVGLGYPRQVDNAFEAFELLCEWHGPRGPTHAAALKACRAALDGKVEAETARGVLEAFARATGCLVPDAAAIVANNPRPARFRD